MSNTTPSLSSATAPPRTFARAGSTLDLGADAQAAEEMRPFSLFFRSALEDEFRVSLLLATSTGVPLGGGNQTKGLAKELRQLLWSIIALCLLFFSVFAPDAYNYHNAPGSYTKKIVLEGVGGGCFLLIFILNKYKARYQEWIGMPFWS